MHGSQIFLLEDYECYLDLTCNGPFIVTRSHNGQCLQHQALLALSDVMDFCNCHGGLQHPLPIRYLVTMEDWAREWSNVDLNAAARVRRVEILAGVAVDKVGGRRHVLDLHQDGGGCRR